MQMAQSVALGSSVFLPSLGMTAGLPHAAVIQTKPFSDCNGDDAGATGDDGAADDAVGVDDTDVDVADVDAAGTALPPVWPQPVSAARPNPAQSAITRQQKAMRDFLSRLQA